MEKSKVYFTKEITPESLVKIYQALGVELKGKVGVKISTGEPGGNNYLHAELIGKLVKKLNGTIIECCTAYEGRRMDPKEHWKAIKEHGFKAMAPCDIMDEFGEMKIPVENGFHLDKDIVGEHLADYDRSFRWCYGISCPSSSDRPWCTELPAESQKCLHR